MSYEDKIEHLKTQIPEFSKKKDNINFHTDNIYKLQINPNKFQFKFWYVYCIIPIVFLLLFMIWRPMFIKVSYIDEQGTENYKIHWGKYFLWVLFLSALLIIPLFGYRYKTNKPYY